jgi:uncharacterized protein YjbI with pentapeptide repeats
MADPPDPFDVKALEQSVNDSAVRVSTIWVSFLVFGLYLVVAAGAVTHRQLMLEDPVKLPVLNVDLPLVGFFVLAPVLFVILHAYVLVQVLLLARTAAAYNEALERSVAVVSDRARVRQRLANTLFAQMFAGSPREREGLLGAFLRLMAWITLAIAPVLVLLTFEVKFLPYHSSLVTWNLRVLIALDLAGVLLLWRGVLDARRDITWRGLVEQRAALVTAVPLVLFAGILVTFPGERHTSWMRFGDENALECSSLFSVGIFTGRLSLAREVLIDTEKLAKIEAASKAIGQKANEGERTRHFDGRDLSCGQFFGADLRRAGISGANLGGATLFVAQLQGADLNSAQLQGANLHEAQLQGATLFAAQIQGADLRGAHLQGADLGFAQLQGADLREAQLQGANLTGAQLQGADLRDAQLQGADLNSAQLQGADLREAQLQGARLDKTLLTLSNLSRPYIWRASGMKCDDAQVTAPQFRKVAEIKFGNAQPEAFIEKAVRHVPEPGKQTLQARLHARLVTNVHDDTASEQVWAAWAAKALNADEYARKHADYLVNLACSADSVQENQKYVAEGIYRNWGPYRKDARAVALARGLLGLDGKPCPGAKDFDEKTTERLRGIAATKPVN